LQVQKLSRKWALPHSSLEQGLHMSLVPQHTLSLQEPHTSAQVLHTLARHMWQVPCMSSRERHRFAQVRHTLKPQASNKLLVLHTLQVTRMS
jgi:hypothetical protein